MEEPTLLLRQMEGQAVRRNRPRPGQTVQEQFGTLAEKRRPYILNARYESDPLWNVVNRAYGELVKNGDLIEQCGRDFPVGCLVEAIRASGALGAKVIPRRPAKSSKESGTR